MAKKSQKVALDISVLQRIAASAEGFAYVSIDEGKPLVQHDPQLIEVNTQMTDGEGRAAARLTAAGQAMVAPANAAPASSGSEFAIITNATKPTVKRGKVAGAATKYPFDKLEIGASFFVPVSADTPDPVKTMQSTVSNANRKWSEGTGTFKDVERTKRGDGNKAVVDANGNKVRETVKVEERKALRKFSIRAVKSGQTLGEWKAPADGALVFRDPVE